jgi:hypothetical protein
MASGGKIYDTDLAFYKEMRQFHHRFETPYSWMIKTKEMNYYHHWANSVMFEFLNSSDDITTVIENLQMKTLHEYFSTKSLF